MTYASRYLRITNPLMMGIDVKNVQERLTELGYYGGEIRGVYDKATAEAVQVFQRDKGYPADGVVDPVTWEAIGLSEDAGDYFDTQYSMIVDLTDKKLTLREGQNIIKQYPVAIGKPETPTPTGDWRIIQKSLNPGGPFGSRWMRLNVPWGGYGIHGTDVPASIGTAASHGCIRMNNEDVIELYDIVPLGTSVRIIGGNYSGRLLQQGVEPGEDINDVQQKLRLLGYYKGIPNGKYDAETQDAVRRFQKDYGFVDDGVVGPETYQALQKLSDTVLGDIEP